MNFWDLEPLAKVWTAAFFGAVVLSFSGVQAAYDGQSTAKVASEFPEELKNVGIDEKLGDKIDLTLKVRNENGELVELGSFFDGKHPVILSPVYFTCPGLCNFHLNGLTDGLKLLDDNWTVGKKFKVVAFSFDSKDQSDSAALKKSTYVKLYERPGSADGWHFVTADEEVVQKLTSSVGFKFRWDDKVNDWAHASAAIILTPEGVISRYLHGIMFEPKDVRIALNEATEGKIGNIVDSIMLFCFKYDPQQSKYALVASNVMKVGGAIMVLLMILWLMPMYIRSVRAKSKAGR